jgi:hypothetical protein
MKRSLPVSTQFEDTEAGEKATNLGDLQPPVSPSGREAYKKHPQLSKRCTHTVAAPVKLGTKLGGMRHVSRLDVRRVVGTLTPATTAFDTSASATAANI